MNGMFVRRCRCCCILPACCIRFLLSLGVGINDSSGTGGSFDGGMHSNTCCDHFEVIGIGRVVVSCW